MTETILDLLRHGEPEGGSRYRGHAVDDPLTEKGWAQMREGLGDHASWDLIISSPLRRCREFAESVGRDCEIPVQVDERFKEIGFGQWEGKNKNQLKAERPEEFAAFYRDPVRNTPKDAEPVCDFHSRITLAVDDVLTTHAGKRILIVAHAGVIRATLVHAINAPVESMYNFDVINGRVSRIRAREGQTHLELVNSSL